MNATFHLNAAYQGEEKRHHSHTLASKVLCSFELDKYFTYVARMLHPLFEFFPGKVVSVDNDNDIDNHILLKEYHLMHHTVKVRLEVELEI